ncbi:hypothetical protein [Actinotalea sp. JY-7876]|uniref:hypothetical protein n=1 Tax=Actinotalea sp. JY-7876 TaxID=2758442 RepID=UPI0015F66A54|nr:hypothetical protein [Actinotalea sp. JY-7876]
MPIATLLARRATVELANSARPDAPVVPGRPPRRRARADVVRVPRARSALATALRRAADAVAPPHAHDGGPHLTAH